MTQPRPQTAATASPAMGADRDVLQRLLDRAVGEGGVPGIVIEVRNDRGRWFGTAGVADTDTGRERTPQERFRIGSATKTFVATVILQLVAERRLSLDDTVDEWLPGRVHGHGHQGGKISIRRLLNHTSGIFNYTEDPPMVNRYEKHTPELLVDIAMAHPPAFEAGADWGYSNTNYILAGMIVERVTGQALADEIARRITRPLGLDGTYLPSGADPTIQGPHPRHYTKLMNPAPDAEIHDATELESSMFWAAGGMISTTGDLHRFFGALLGGRLLPPAQHERMFTTVPTKNWIPDTTYGLGISSVTLPCGATVWGMGGAIFGSWSYTYGTRDGEHMVVIDVNGDWANGPWDDPIGIFTDVLQAEFCPPKTTP
ncbi:serine hydrolase domain-containing protein [Microtetraspora fusca]|uniref:serine hydrolase domain-containing protein n=1 Tax=Microtetraspora fusca TaxID=1997 RepID=UPI0009FBDA90|nr:serine hydrolase domain-containing protein [Microtetraspora fusca]